MRELLNRAWWDLGTPRMQQSVGMCHLMRHISFDLGRTRDHIVRCSWLVSCQAVLPSHPLLGANDFAVMTECQSVALHEHVVWLFSTRRRTGHLLCGKLRSLLPSAAPCLSCSWSMQQAGRCWCVTSHCGGWTHWRTHPSAWQCCSRAGSMSRQLLLSRADCRSGL